MNLLPAIARFDECDNDAADESLRAWGHWLGGCNRPFGRQSFGLWFDGALVGVAVSASTVNGKCGCFVRSEVVELARLCCHPDHRDLTRVLLRLWRKSALANWSQRYWPCIAAVSYANAIRHKGDIYRFDGWVKIADVRGGVAGQTWQDKGKRKSYDPKSVWAWPKEAVAAKEAAA